MSNPGVIVLDSVNSKGGKFRRFSLEDNIGEAIHLHIDNMRLDFTVHEFLEFSALIRVSLDKIDFLHGFKLKDFDAQFLRSCADYLVNLEDIRVEEMRLSDLRSIVPMRRNKGGYLYKESSVRDLPEYKYLTGDKTRFSGYGLNGSYAVNYESLLLNTLVTLQKKGYPADNKHIVLFNGQDYVRYGQDIAAILGFLHGIDKKIKIMRFYFKGRSHLLSPLKSNIRTVLRGFFKKRNK